MQAELISLSQLETAHIAAVLARSLKAGDVVFLKGPLGAGKTSFIQAAATELGVAEAVTSPSFTLARTYAGPIMVHHLDLYRLSGFDSHDDAELEPYFSDDSITFVEWPEPIEDFIEAGATVIIEHLDRESRRITIYCSPQALSSLEELDADAGH